MKQLLDSIKQNKHMFILITLIKNFSSDVSKPLIDKNFNLAKPCFNASCEQGCDEANGECICFKGYKLSNTGECIGKNQ